MKKKRDSIPASIIDEYRNNTQALGIWDESFASIKRDLPNIRARLYQMNLAYDLAGMFAEQVLLAMRLLTYGKSNADYTTDDIKIMFVPLREIVSETNTHIRNIGNDAAGFVFQALPICFTLMKDKKLEINNVNDYHRVLRAMVMHIAKIESRVIGISILLDYCLAKYGMEDIRDYISTKALANIQASKSEDTLETLNNAIRLFGKGYDLSNNHFVVNFGTLLHSVNLGETSYMVVADLISEMRLMISKRESMGDCLEFIDSDGFDEMINHVLKYHGINGKDKEDDDEEDWDDDE